MIQPSFKDHRAARRESILKALLSATEALHHGETGGEVRRALGHVSRAIQAEAAQLLKLDGQAAPDHLRPVVTWSLAEENEEPLGVSERSLNALLPGEVETLRDEAILVEKETAPLILCPVPVEEALWGCMLFQCGASAGDLWTEETAGLLQPFARHVAAWLRAHKGAFASQWDMQKDGASTTAGLPEVEANQLQRRVESQRALVEASKLLVSSGDFAMEELLQIVGGTTGADYAYLLSIHPEGDAGPSPLSQRDAGQPPIDLDSYTHYEWHVDGSRRTRRSDPMKWSDKTEDADGSTFAVPLLSSQNLLYGYLGIEFEDDTSPLQDEDVRLLNVLGDMLCTYLQRQIADRALRKSERRYRYFIGTISEAIWRIDFDPAIDISKPPDQVVAAVADQGVIAECNHEFARLLGVDQSEQLMGWSVDQLTTFTGQRIVQDLVDAGFRLQNQEFVIYDEHRDPRHFIVNTSEVIEDGKLSSVWGSNTEVTERVHLERRMVTALEQQQQRIGRDLHDSVGQLLAGVRMLAQNLEERHFGAGTPGHKQIEKIISYASEAAEHVSNLQRGLMPVQMEQGGLAQALKELASNTDVHPDVDCIYVHDGTTDVRGPEEKLQLYRIAQEATNNALKHGKPSYIKIVLKTIGSMLRLEVEDDGIGFDVDAVTNDPHALHSMHYRARSINAELHVQSSRGHGTTIRCEVDCGELGEH